MYFLHAGFHRVKNTTRGSPSSESIQYSHPLFIRGRTGEASPSIFQMPLTFSDTPLLFADLMTQIHRRGPEHSASKTESDILREELNGHRVLA